MARDLDQYYGDDYDEHLTPQQREEQRLRQLDQNMAASAEDMQKVQFMRMRDEAEQMKKTNPRLVSKLKAKGKSPEQFIMDRNYRGDLLQQEWDKGETEFLDKLYDESGNVRQLQHPLMQAREQEEDFWGDKPPASPPEGGSERAASYNELQKENPQALTCDDKVEEQFRALTGLPPKKRIRR